MGEPWVVNHWLPFDEQRLYTLLRSRRAEVWRWLRDDHRTLERFALDRGWRAPALARALVAPRRPEVSAARLAVLRARALRVLTQGHLAQHLMFHSLHQTAIQNASPTIFGVRTKAVWDGLRLDEMSPIRIGRLHGRTRVQVQWASDALLRSLARIGVRRRETSRSQAALLLARQLRQLPRWLQQDRNNGPPPTGPDGMSLAPAHYYANHPAIAADGGLVAFEAYQPDNRIAASYGEIRVDGWAAGSREVRALSRPRPNGPWSSYNPSLSADGRFLAFETAAGNRNFGKRYGAIDVRVLDRVSGRSQPVPNPSGRTASEYQPSVSADGRLVAYEAQEGVERGGRPSYSVRASVYDRLTRRTTTVRRSAPGVPDGGVWESRLSADGRFLVFDSPYATRGAPRPSRSRAQVYRYEFATRRTELVSRASGRAGMAGDGESFEPQISADGRFVAYASTATNLVPRLSGHRSRVYLRDLDTGVTTLLSPRDTFAWQPALAGSGGRVAYVLVRRDLHRRVRALRSSTIWVRDLPSGPARAASLPARATTSASGVAFSPALSADGQMLVFVSEASTLSRRKADPSKGVFVRNLSDGQLELASSSTGKHRDH